MSNQEVSPCLDVDLEHDSDVPGEVTQSFLGLRQRVLRGSVVAGLMLALGLVALSGTGKSANARQLSEERQLWERPCQCEANDDSWKAPKRTQPKCIFIDLGAADGNSFQAFLDGTYGTVDTDTICPQGNDPWEAILVEANPEFTMDLMGVSEKFSNVMAYGSTAAYMCRGKTRFAIDPDVAHNRWGSSMTRDFDRKITVPTLNVAQLIVENTIPADKVILKMDVEGAEFDILPCLAQLKNVGNLVDIIYEEEHWDQQYMSAFTKAQFDEAKQSLTADMKMTHPGGAPMPDYNTVT